MRINTRKIRYVTAGKHPDDTLIMRDVNKEVSNCVCVRHKVRLPLHSVYVEVKHIVRTFRVKKERGIGRGRKKVRINNYFQCRA